MALFARATVSIVIQGAVECELWYQLYKFLARLQIICGKPTTATSELSCNMYGIIIKIFNMTYIPIAKLQLLIEELSFSHFRCLNTWEASRGENFTSALMQRKKKKKEKKDLCGWDCLVDETSQAWGKHTRNRTVAQYLRTSRFILTSSRLL